MDIERSGGQSPRVENGYFLEVNPSDLMKDNPAALIVNQTMYKRIAAGEFSPVRCGKPQAARVKTYSAEHGEVIRLFVTDGLTRTKYVNDHYLDEIQHKHPGWKFRVEDMTEEILKDITIVFPQERQADQQALTMLQYLRAIVEPTKIHAEIAPDRIAAHLINGWEVMVGKELAEKFSATAALSFLAETTVAERMLRDHLRKQTQLVVGIDEEADKKLRQSLLDVAAVIREAGLDSGVTAKSAFLLVGVHSPVIGGERKAREEIYGVLYSPEVDSKLSRAFPDKKVDQELMRGQFDKALQQLFQNFAVKPDSEIIIRQTLKALKDDNIELHHFRDIVAAQNPAIKYERIVEQINRDRLVNTYLQIQGKEALTGFELILIEQLGGKVADAKIILDTIITIGEACDILHQVADFRNQLTEQRSELLKSGVRPELLDESVTAVNNLQSGLLATQNPQTVISRTKTLVEEMIKTRERITTQQQLHSISSVVDEISGEELRSVFGGLTRTQLITWMLRELKAEAKISELTVKTRLEQLRKLRPEFQREVVEVGGMRIETALQRQREKEARVTQAVSGIKEETQPVDEVDKRVESVTVVELPSAVPEDTVSPPLESADALRRRVNIERFSQVSALVLRVFGVLDLDLNEIPRSEVEKSDEAFRMWGRTRFKHPDVVRLITDTLEEQQRRIKHLEDRIGLDREQTDKDTRTGR